MAAARPSRRAGFPTDWFALTETTRPLFAPTVEDRGKDQYLACRDKTYAVIQDDEFIRILDARIREVLRSKVGASPALVETIGPAILEALLEELRACTREAEVVLATAHVQPRETNKARAAQMSRLSVTLGSLKDVVGDVPYLKIGIGLYQELVEFFK